MCACFIEKTLRPLPTGGSVRRHASRGKGLGAARPNGRGRAGSRVPRVPAAGEEQGGKGVARPCGRGGEPVAAVVSASMRRHNGRDTDVWTLCASACSSAPWWAAGPSRPDVGACEFCMLCCSRARAMSAVAPKAFVRRASSPCFASLMARLSWRRAPIADARAEVGRSPTSASCVRSPASITATFWPTSSRTPTCPCWGPARMLSRGSRHAAATIAAPAWRVAPPTAAPNAAAKTLATASRSDWTMIPLTCLIQSFPPTWARLSGTGRQRAGGEVLMARRARARVRCHQLWLEPKWLRTPVVVLKRLDIECHPNAQRRISGLESCKALWPLIE